MGSGCEQFWAELVERLRKFRLELHPEKTRPLEFGPGAAESRNPRSQGKPETFNFLGFTHSCARTQKGRFTVLRQTMRTRWQAKLKDVKVQLRRGLHLPIPEQGTYLRAVVVGHLRYYGVPMNGPALSAFRAAVGRLWWRVLRRRSQRHRLPWHRMWRYINRWLPTVRIYHPYPLVRFGVFTQGGSRMR